MYLWATVSVRKLLKACSKRLHPVVQGLKNMIFTLQVVGEITKSILDEEGEYKPVDGPEISSLILIDRG